MKNNFLSSTLRAAKSAVLAGTVLMGVMSCDRDDTPPEVTHKIVYKAEVSGGTITSGKYMSYEEVKDGKPVILSDVPAGGDKWSKEVTTTMRQGIKNPALLVMKATGTNDSSTLKIQIYVDGQLKSEKIATGQVLNADTQIEFVY
ncbi:MULTISPECIES: hypothetical protein [Chryseobacterium]|uniref:Lipoprotein n=1 Tax=Chryseobacterium geocarposphaerae TaxID=1416776 RepID=A0ABU1LC30_9FLAO|nr:MULTISPECIES: hypothetical protein [Chryseobacterium]MDR6404267.1 hypothetical protein [Chryseobacterium geocarposphaerae]MDR6699265.1 hypothetical protein [Chryseobacterium ginsenosidimutans]